MVRDRHLLGKRISIEARFWVRALSHARIHENVVLLIFHSEDTRVGAFMDRPGS